MTDILENARQHFLAKKAAPLRVISVPEWGAEFRVKSLNLAETAEIEAARSKSPMGGIIKTLMLRLVDETGARVFKAHHERILSEEVDPAVVSRIVLDIMREDTPPEDIEKN